jgi:hypothetical protein
MKRTLIIGGFIAGVLIIGSVAFLALVGINRYRPVVERKLQEAIGCPVMIGRLSLGWQDGLAMECQGVNILSATGRPPQPLLQLESVSVLVRLAPLFHKRLDVASVVLKRPRLHVKREADGRINLMGLAALGGPVAAPSRASQRLGAPVPFAIASLRIVEGTLHWTDARSTPPYRLTVTNVEALLEPIAPGVPITMAFRGALASDRQNLRLSARVLLPDAVQPGSAEQLDLSLEDIALQRILPEVSPAEPHLLGRRSLKVQGRLPTLDPLQVSRAFSAGGRLTLTEAKVANLNVLRAVFERLSMLPGLIERLQGRLPPAYQERLTRPDTMLAPMAFTGTVRQGVLEVDDLKVGAEGLELSGTGWVGFPGAMRFHGVLRVEPELSRALIAGVNELERLTNAQGQLEFPLTIRGQFPRVAVLPDLDIIATKLLVTRVQDILGNILQQTLE